jgi:hypothetical protein
LFTIYPARYLFTHRFQLLQVHSLAYTKFFGVNSFEFCWYILLGNSTFAENGGDDEGIKGNKGCARRGTPYREHDDEGGIAFT